MKRQPNGETTFLQVLLSSESSVSYRAYFVLCDSATLAHYVATCMHVNYYQVTVSVHDCVFIILLFRVSSAVHRHHNQSCLKIWTILRTLAPPMNPILQLILIVHLKGFHQVTSEEDFTL